MTKGKGRLGIEELLVDVAFGIRELAAALVPPWNELWGLLVEELLVDVVFDVRELAAALAPPFTNQQRQSVPRIQCNF